MDLDGKGSRVEGTPVEGSPCQSTLDPIRGLLRSQVARRCTGHLSDGRAVKADPAELKLDHSRAVGSPERRRDENEARRANPLAVPEAGRARSWPAWERGTPPPPPSPIRVLCLTVSSTATPARGSATIGPLSRSGALCRRCCHPYRQATSWYVALFCNWLDAGRDG